MPRLVWRVKGRGRALGSARAALQQAESPPSCIGRRGPWRWRPCDAHASVVPRVGGRSRGACWASCACARRCSPPRPPCCASSGARPRSLPRRTQSPAAPRAPACPPEAVAQLDCLVDEPLPSRARGFSGRWVGARSVCGASPAPAQADAQARLPGAELRTGRLVRPGLRGRAVPAPGRAGDDGARVRIQRPPAGASHRGGPRAGAGAEAAARARAHRVGDQGAGEDARPGRASASPRMAPRRRSGRPPT
jgi:hypothetical protein